MVAVLVEPDKEVGIAVLVELDKEVEVEVLVELDVKEGVLEEVGIGVTPQTNSAASSIGEEGDSQMYERYCSSSVAFARFKVVGSTEK